FRQWSRRPVATARELVRDRLGRAPRLGAGAPPGGDGAPVGGAPAPPGALRAAEGLPRGARPVPAGGRFLRGGGAPGEVLRLCIPRERLLSTLGRCLGLDLYVRAVK